MPWTEFTLGLVKALAWPLTVFLVALVFRHEMRGILKRLSRVKYGDLEAHFEKDLEKAERNATQIQIPFDRTLEATKPTEYERMIQLIEISPCAAIMEAWREIELAASRAIQAADIKVKRKIIGTPEVWELLHLGLLSKDMFMLYSDLRHLRNKVAHSPTFDLSENLTKRYVDLASKIIAKLNEIAENPTTLRLSDEPR